MQTRGGHGRGLAAALSCVALLGMAASAQALVVHLPDGHAVGVLPRPAVAGAPAARIGASGRSGPANRFASPVITSSYMGTIGRYLVDVGADSGKSTNVYGVGAEYGAPPAPHGVYQSTFGRNLIDTAPYPADQPQGNPQGCVPGPSVAPDPPYTACLTDQQVQSELSSIVASQNLPVDMSSVYFVLLPAGIDECMGPGAQGSGNPCADTDFCAYHSPFSGSTTFVPPLYAVLPWADVSGCQSGEAPNSSTQTGDTQAADDQISVLSHEHIETITDPLLNAWADAQGNEIADKCAGVFGSALGGTAGSGFGNPGNQWNQVINGSHYWLQEEFSNTDGSPPGQCVQLPGQTMGNAQRDTGPLLYTGGPVLGAHTTYTIFWDPSQAANAPTAALTPGSASVAPGTAVSFDASASRDPRNEALTYFWRFDDGASTVTSAPTASHAFAAIGRHGTSLTVVDADGLISAPATATVGVFNPPTASFTMPATTVTVGRPVAFDASSSAAPNGTITGYAWSFGDGASASGAQASHTFTRAGTFTVSLGVTDSNGLTGSRAAPITVLSAPATIARAGSPKLQVKGSAWIVNTGRRMACPAAATGRCHGTVKLTTRISKLVKGRHGRRRRVNQTVTIGTATLSVAPGHSLVVTVRLNQRGKTLLRQRQKLAVAAQITAQATGAKATVFTEKFTLKAPSGKQAKP